MRRIAVFLLGALALLLLAGGSWLAWTLRGSFYRETIQVPTGWSRPMLEDDTLLLQKWLTRQGWSARREGGLLHSGALPPQGLLVLMRLEPALKEGDVDQLLAWVKEGGHLLVDGSAAPFNDGQGTRALFDRLGVQLVEQEPGEESEEGPSIRAPEKDTFASGEDPYAIRRAWKFRLTADLAHWDFALGSGDKQVLLQRLEGRGSITLASDLSFLYNQAFDELDHAAWLARVLEKAPSAKTAVVWSKPVERAFLPWLWRHAWAFLIACGVLLLAWLWRGLWRFGPLLPDALPQRRSLLEHLQACGRFIWRHGGQEYLVASSRGTALRLAARLHPIFPYLDEEERWVYLAEHSGLSSAEIAQALDDRPGATPEVLARQLQILQHLRHRLTRKP
jgi:hypothetical protein